MSDMMVIPEITIREITNDGSFVHIPLEKMHLFVLQADAVLLGWMCFGAGLIIGITVTYFWYRGRIKEWQPEDH
jgi:hypothetical protein